MKLLQDAKFEEISANDLLLTRTLKTDYLLTLPIYVDWKKALESNAVIFRHVSYHILILHIFILLPFFPAWW